MNTPYELPGPKTQDLVDTAARAAEAVGSDARRAAHTVADSAAQLRDKAAPALHELAEDAKDVARSGVNAVRDQATHWRDTSAGYVREHPLQTVLIAAGVGAVLALLTNVLTHRDSARH